MFWHFMQNVSTEDNLHGMSNPVEIICMKCKNLFSGKNEKKKKKKKKKIKMLSAENFTQST